MQIIIVLTDYGVEGLIFGERRKEKVMGKFSHCLIYE